MKDKHKLPRTWCSLLLATLLVTSAPISAIEGKLEKDREAEGQFCAASKSQPAPGFLLPQDGPSRAFRETAIPRVFDVLSPGRADWVKVGEFRLLKRLPYSLPDHFRSDELDNVKTSLMFGEFTAPSGESDFVSAIVTAARRNPPRDSNDARLTFFGIVDRGSSASGVLAVTELIRPCSRSQGQS